MLFITCGGMAGVLGAAVELSTRTGGSKDVPIAIVFFGMLAIVVIDALLFSLLWKLINAALSPLRAAKKQAAVAAQLPLARTGRLQPAPSVTENTTRFFDQYVPAGSSPEPAAAKKRSDS